MASRILQLRIQLFKYTFLRPKTVFNPEMSFLPRYFHQDTGYGPFSRFIDEIAHHTREHKNNPPFQPKFDVTELENAYELHGELPGLEKKDVHVEFVEPHTLLIRGTIERSRTFGTPPEGWPAASPSASTEGHEDSVQKDISAADKNEAQNGGPDTVTETVKKEESTVHPKLWVAERSIGEFSRTFSLPHHIQQDGVEASLDNGILFVRIPKTEKPEGHVIRIK